MVNIRHETLLFLHLNKEVLEEIYVEFENPVKDNYLFRFSLDGIEDIPSPPPFFDFISEIPIADFIGFFDLNSVRTQIGLQMLPACLIQVIFQRENDRQFILTHKSSLRTKIWPVPGTDKEVVYLYRIPGK
jgi:hypothetical protein